VAKAKPAPKETCPAEEPAGYTVVARRYRPQQLTDLIGQEHVATALTNAIESGRIAHAYLFTGARGTGKTSTARILAKALNCEKGPTPKPCDTCGICTGIIEGGDADCIEIDGASNNKVDEVRELRNNVNFRPTRARFKVYIIDEVHMLTTGAFNALLKTLEEPPEHVKFILATTEVQKIPITILSRCQRYDFRHIGPNKVFETLKHIVGKEGLQAEDDALRIVAKRAAGSMRDAQSLLDQLLAFSTGPLTAASIRELLGASSDEQIADLADAILRKDAKAAVDLVADAISRGLPLGELLDQLTEYWRALMLVAVGGAAIADVVTSPTQTERITAHSKTVSIDTVLAGLDVLTTAKGRVRASTHVAVIVEAAVVRLCRLEELVAVNQLAATIASGAVTLAPTVPAVVKKNEIHPPIRPAVTAPATNGQHRELTESTVESLWPLVLNEVGLTGGMILGKAGPPAILAPNSLALRFDANYSREYDQAASSTMQATLVASLKKLTGAEWTVRVEKRATRPGETVNGSTETPAEQSAGRQKAILSHVLLAKIRETLGGQLVRMEDGFNPDRAEQLPLAIPAGGDDDDDNPSAAADTEDD
jgi:DNA polymerase-3 subunit gamma/tau